MKFFKMLMSVSFTAGLKPTSARSTLWGMRSWAGYNCGHTRLKSSSHSVCELSGRSFAIHSDRCAASAVIFRDVLLRKEPLLLASLLQGATSPPPHESDDLYLKTCVVVLSKPLPDDVPPPALLRPFLQRLLDFVIERPSSSTIRALYQTIKGIGIQSFEILPARTIVDLQNILLELLTQLDDHCANLLCLAIFAIFHQASKSPLSSEGIAPSAVARTSRGGGTASNDDRYHAAHQLFTKRAAKTLNLVVVRVIVSSSSTTDLDRSQIIERMDLSKSILEAVDDDEKNLWVQKNATKIHKLQERVTQQNIDLFVRVKTFEMLPSLLDIMSLPENVVLAMEQALQQSPLLSINPTLVKPYLNRFSDHWIQLHFHKILRAAGYCSEVDEMDPVEIGYLLSSIRDLSDTLQSSSRVRRILNEALGTSSFRESLQQIVATPEPDSLTRHEQQSLCPRTLKKLRRAVQSDLCRLLLKTIFYNLSDNIRFDPCVSFMLLDAMKLPPLAFSRCEICPQPLADPSVTCCSLQAVSSPQHCSDAREWQRGLKAELHRHAAQCHELVVAKLGEVCRNLEARCESIEEPLRMGEGHSDDLQMKVDIAYTRCKDLEDQARERSLALEGLEAENTRLLHRSERIEEQQQSMVNEIDRLKTELEQRSAATRHASELATDAARLQELDKLACTAARDETIEHLRSEIKSQGHRMEDLDAEISSFRNEAAGLQEMLSQREETIHRLESFATAKRDEIERMVERERCLSLHIVSLEDQLDTLRSETMTIDEHRLGMIEDLKGTTDQLQAKHNVDVERRDRELREQQEKFNEDLSTLRKEAEEANRRAASFLAQQRNEIRRLESRLANLLEEQEERANEFHEAQELSSRLMAIVGRRSATTDRPAGSKPNLKQLNGREYLQGTLHHRVDDLLKDRNSSVPRSKHKPKPKRAKFGQNAALFVPLDEVDDQGYEDVSMPGVNAHMPPRCPLQDLDTGTQTRKSSRRDERALEDCNPCKPQHGSTGTGNRSVRLSHDMENLSFDESSIFTSTVHGKQLDGTLGEAQIMCDGTTRQLGRIGPWSQPLDLGDRTKQ